MQHWDPDSWNEPCAGCTAAPDPSLKLDTWIQCEQCDAWYHGRCARVSDPDAFECWYCTPCIGTSNGTLKPRERVIRRSARSVKPVHYANLDDSLPADPHRFVALLKTKPVNSAYKVKTVTPQDLEEALDADAEQGQLGRFFSEPLLVPEEYRNDLGLKFPKELSVPWLVDALGTETLVPVIDVASQASKPWTLGEWGVYYIKNPHMGPEREEETVGGKEKIEKIPGQEKTARGPDGAHMGHEKPLSTCPSEPLSLSPSEPLSTSLPITPPIWPDTVGVGDADLCVPDLHPRDKIRNVISLEVSESEAGDMFCEPEFVRRLDWVHNFWPKERTEDRPRVTKYCLMSVAHSWTDWHIDFAGTSVFYHVVYGEKIFYMIRPTEHNLRAFERWTSSADQDSVWLGDWIEDDIKKIKISKGQTMFIPTGWIHAVYTIYDSLTYGGNYLHSLHVRTQLRISEIENRTHVAKDSRFPLLGDLQWYVVRGYENMGPVHKKRIEPLVEHLRTEVGDKAAENKAPGNKAAEDKAQRRRVRATLQRCGIVDAHALLESFDGSSRPMSKRVKREEATLSRGKRQQ